MRLASLTWPVLVLLFTSGCAGTLRNYSAEINNTMQLADAGQIEQSLQSLDKNNPDKNKDLLYYLEKGELLRLNQQYKDSIESWRSADEKIALWESEAKLNSSKVASNVGSFLINDKAHRYDGQDYEKVMLSVRLAMTNLALGDWEAARVEIKKTHERETLISELRSKEVSKLESEAQERKIKTEFKDLGGYPVETLNDPAVIALKNGYQSAFGHYLAGFIYEAMNEPGLAAPGYRKAIELRPHVPLLEEGLKSLDQRAKQRKPGFTDVLFVVETGSAPARESMQIPLPAGRAGIVAVSFPVIRPTPAPFTPSVLELDNGRALPLSLVSDVELMARRALRDEMPGIILRSTVRALAKGAMQKTAYEQGGALLGLLVNVAGIATETADLRAWRTLPARISVARAQLPNGEHQIRFDTPNGPQTFQVTLRGEHTVIPVRLMGQRLLIAQPQYPAETMLSLREASAAADSSGAIVSAPAQTAKVLPKKKSKRNSTKRTPKGDH